MHHVIRATLAVTLILIPLAAGCRSTQESQASKPDSGRWLKPSPLLEQQMQDEAERLPFTRGIERIEQIRWFAALGEPAYDTLIELLADPRDDVASSALSALGATGDRRLVPFIAGARGSTRERGRDLQLERARTLLRLGEWSEVPLLIEGLADTRLYTRALCIQALEEATGERHGFDPRGTDRDRERSVERWKAWWLQRSGDPMRTPRLPAATRPLADAVEGPKELPPPLAEEPVRPPSAAGTEGP
jgi:HEAT repeat protein